MTTNDLKLQRDGWLSYGAKPHPTRTTFGTVTQRLKNGNVLVSDGRGGEIEFRPHNTSTEGAGDE